jgi:hypothetical protein
MKDKTAITGGCFCGAVRYEISGKPEGPAVCYCEDCRKTVGAQSVAWVTVPEGSFRWTGDEAVRYASSEHVVRTFCGTCGTSLTYRHDSRIKKRDVTIASLDRPEDIPPAGLVFPSGKLPWDDLLGLPVIHDL